MKILEEKIKEAKPDERDIEKINEESREVIEKLGNALKACKIKAEIFIGGSSAKGTIIRKKRYDIDIFVRFDVRNSHKIRISEHPKNPTRKQKDFFDKKHEDISELLDKCLKKAKLKAERIHGSRDYFRLVRKNLFEIIPVLKINRPEEAKNVTDLSYFHVSYILKRIKKNKNLANEIVLAKSFCYAQKCYGAESYIHGFSGYALELLVSYYGSFLNFIKAVIKAKEQIVIDPAHYYKNRDEILLNLNEAKLASPIVFVDPTFKERNVLAALSRETFEKFQEAGKAFLKKPTGKFFEMQEINEKNFNYILEAETDRQAGDIAGSKLLKFYNFFRDKLDKYFIIKKSDFEYDDKKIGRYFFKLENRKERILNGPPITKIENLNKFKSRHKNVFIKAGKAYAREKINIGFKEFLAKLKNENKQVMDDMGIIRLKIIN